MRRVLTFFLAAFVTGIVAQADDWWNPDWKVRHCIDINTGVIFEDLHDFPVRVRIEAANTKHDPATGGADARVVDAVGNTLDVEVVQWDVDGIELYARVPHINTKTCKQRLYLYYGNPSAAASQAADLWDASYRAVLHLHRNTKDASGNNVVVTEEGSLELEQSGAIFTEQPGYLNLAPEALNGIGEQLTIAMRFRMIENPGLQNLASGRYVEGKDEWFNFGIKTPNIVHTNAASEGKRVGEMNPAGIAPGEWHSAVIRYDARDRSRTICIDGTVFERDEALPGPLRINELRIGRGVLHFEPWQFHGTIDEVRISDVARSDSWMKAEAGNLAEYDMFAPVRAAQEFGGPEPTLGSFTIVSPKTAIVWKKRNEPLSLSWTPSAGADFYIVVFSNASGQAKQQQKVVAGNSLLVTRSLEATASQPIEKLFVLNEPSAQYTWEVMAVSEKDRLKEKEKRVDPSIVHAPSTISFYDWSTEKAMRVVGEVKLPLSSARDAEFDLHGYLRTRIDNAIDEFLISTPSTSPAILQVLRDRDKTPMREPLVPWAGEFAGKYLTSAQLTWRLTRDEELKNVVDRFVKDLIACQQEDGYLGPFPKSSRITGGNWDVWGHYHCMLGLMLYYEDTRYEPALETCKKAADLLFETFGTGGPSLINDGGGGQMNMAVGHGLMLLYNKTGIERYLDLAKYVVHEAWNDAGAGRYLESALAGKPIVEFPQHRWEAIHDWQALPELYWLTGDEQYKKAYEHMWWSAVKGDRHNTGGLTSGEGFTGSPFNTGAIETCCTVAWLAMSIDMLRLTGDARVADEIELSTLNSALGAIPYAGRSCAYNVPMNGTRLFGVELHWQAPKGGPDLNCCSVNANRPLGMISEWALMEKEKGLAINFYGPCTMKATLLSGNHVTIEQDTQYPADGKVTLKLTLDTPEAFPLFVRVPRWSKKYSMRVNGGGEDRKYTPGSYSGEEREWKTGDVIEIDFDFAPHFWAGQESFANTVSFYRGPILYAYDARYNTLNPGELPKIDPATAQFTAGTFDGDAIPPWIYGTINAADGTPIHVVDLSSAGQTGNQYVSWLPATGPPVSEVVPYAADAR